jgi:hypothetical protein
LYALYIVYYIVIVIVSICCILYIVFQHFHCHCMMFIYIVIVIVVFIYCHCYCKLAYILLLYIVLIYCHCYCSFNLLLLLLHIYCYCILFCIVIVIVGSIYCFCYCSLSLYIVFFIVIVIVVSNVLSLYCSVYCTCHCRGPPQALQQQNTRQGVFVAVNVCPLPSWCPDGRPCKQGGAINCHCVCLLRGQRPSAEETSSLRFGPKYLCVSFELSSTYLQSLAPFGRSVAPRQPPQNGPLTTFERWSNRYRTGLTR